MRRGVRPDLEPVAVSSVPLEAQLLRRSAVGGILVTVKAIIAPMKIGKQTEQGLRFVNRRRAHVSGLTEMDPGQKSLMPLTRRVFGRAEVCSKRGVGPHSEEIPVIARGGKVVRFELYKLSDSVQGGGVGNDRYLAEVWFRRWGRVYVVFLTHLNARIQDHVTPKGQFFNNERWHVTKSSVSFIEARMRAVKPYCDAMIFMADTNVLPVGEGNTDPNSPYAMLKRLGFNVRNSRVVVLATWGLRARKFRVFPAGKNGWPSDHAAIFGNFARPRKRR